jgi:hypothetical protein
LALSATLAPELGELKVSEGDLKFAARALGLEGKRRIRITVSVIAFMAASLLNYIKPDEINTWRGRTFIPENRRTTDLRRNA